MKKVKYIALILVLTLGLIGGAYAAWTDAVEINGTVGTATMDVKWTQFFIRDDIVGDPYNPPDAVPLPAYVDADAYIDSEDNDKAVLTISNLYPSNPAGLNERVAVEGHIFNNSSIPVKYDGAEIVFATDENDVSDYMLVDARIGRMMGNDNSTWTKIAEDNGLSLKDFDSYLDGKLNGLELAVGETLTFGEGTLYFYLAPDAPDTVQGSNLSFTLDIGFKQFNY